MPTTEETLAANLALLIESHRISQSRDELASRMGLASKTLGNVKSARPNPQLGTINAIAQFFRLDPWQMLAPNLGKDAVIRAEDTPPDGYVRLPRLDLEVSAGAGAIADGPLDVVEHLDVLEDWLHHQLGARNPDRIQIVNVRGESMAPTINPGDIAFVDPGVQHFEGDGVYVLTWNGGLLIKRLIAELHNCLSIHSDNPAPGYSTKTLCAEEIEQLHIHGRVVGWWTLRRG